MYVCSCILFMCVASCVLVMCVVVLRMCMYVRLPSVREEQHCWLTWGQFKNQSINLKVGMLLDHGVSLCFALLLEVWTCWAMFQAKNNVRSASASPALTLVSHRSHNMRTTNRHLHTKGKKNAAQRRKKISFSWTMMRALELLLWLAKRHISRRSDVEQWRN